MCGLTWWPRKQLEGSAADDMPAREPPEGHDRTATSQGWHIDTSLQLERRRASASLQLDERPCLEGAS